MDGKDSYAVGLVEAARISERLKPNAPMMWNWGKGLCRTILDGLRSPPPPSMLAFSSPATIEQSVPLSKPASVLYLSLVVLYICISHPSPPGVYDLYARVCTALTRPGCCCLVASWRLAPSLVAFSRLCLFHSPVQSTTKFARSIAPRFPDNLQI